MAADGMQGSPMMRQLTSSEPEVRAKAFDTLRLYLSRGAAFGPFELLKLWKGLFYCMWMTANPRPQQQLAHDLSSLVTQTLSSENALPFVDAFYKTMVREWTNIDRLRMDKYLLLCRYMFRASLMRLAASNFAAKQVAELNRIHEATPLNAPDKKVPNGLRYHILDIFVDELHEVRGKTGQDAMSTETIVELLQPVVELRTKSPTSPVRKRATQTLSDDILKEWGVDLLPQKTDDTADEEEFDGFD